MKNKRAYGLIALVTSVILLLTMFTGALYFRVPRLGTFGKSFFDTLGNMFSRGLNIPGIQSNRIGIDADLFMSLTGISTILLIASCVALIVVGILLLCNIGNKVLFRIPMFTAGAAALLAGIFAIVLTATVQPWAIVSDIHYDPYYNHSYEQYYTVFGKTLVGIGSILMSMFGACVIATPFVIGLFLKDKGKAAKPVYAAIAPMQDEHTMQVNEVRQEIFREQQKQQIAELQKQLEELRGKDKK